MRTRVDQRLRDEVARFRLQFACEHCGYFDDEKRTCSEGYPVAEHLRSDLEREGLLFCKLFEGSR